VYQPIENPFVPTFHICKFLCWWTPVVPGVHATTSSRWHSTRGAKMISFRRGRPSGSCSATPCKTAMESGNRRFCPSRWTLTGRRSCRWVLWTTTDAFSFLVNRCQGKVSVPVTARRQPATRPSGCSPTQTAAPLDSNGAQAQLVDVKCDPTLLHSGAHRARASSIGNESW
jgi:hypothetical protein